MTTVFAGNLVYDVDIDLAKLLEGNEKAQQELENLGKAAKKAEPGLDGLSQSAKGVSTALKMPEVNKLSTQLAQLSGKLGASSESAVEAAAAQDKFTGMLTKASGALGAGYVSNVGSATASLIKHAKAALEATNAQVENAAAAQKEATALQSASSALVLKAAEEKKLAEAAASTAQNELLAAEAVFERKQADVASLEVLLTRQKESLKQAEANLTISQSEKAVAEAVRARNAVDSTSAKILRQSNAAVKEVTQAEDKAKAAKEASAAASAKLAAAVKLEAAALTTVAQANDAAAIATERHTIATKAQALAVAGARSALALLGGPTGVLLLAAAGVYALYQAMRDSNDIDQFTRDIDEAAKRVEYLTRVQASAAASKTEIKIAADTEELKNAETEVNELKNRLSSAVRFNAPTKDIQDLTNKLNVAQGVYDGLNTQINRSNAQLAAFKKQIEDAGDATQSQNSANEVYDSTVKNLTSSNDILKKSIEGSLSAAEEWAAQTQLEKALSDAGVSAEDAASQVAKLHAEFSRKRDLTFDQMLKQTEQNVEALKIEMRDGAAAAAEYRAQIQATNSGLSDDQVAQIGAAARQQAELQQQLSKTQKATKSSSKQADTAANAIKQLTEQNEALSIGLEKGADAQFIHEQLTRAGTKATTEQIQEIERLAAAQIALRQSVENRKKAEEGQKFATSEITSNKSATEQIDIEEQEKLQKIAEYQAIDLENAKLYEDAKTAIQQSASKARQQIVDDEAAKQTQAISSILGSASQGLDGLASIVETASGKANGAYKTLFVASKAFAVAQAGMNLNTAIMQALSDPTALTPAQKMANMAEIAAAGGSVLSAISSASYGGGRENGGPVSADKYYRVGENGKPEIYQASNGNQYMIPGDNGKVISNSDLNSGGAGSVAVYQENHFHIDAAGQVSQDTLSQFADIAKKTTLQTMKEQMRGGGLLSNRK